MPKKSRPAAAPQPLPALALLSPTSAGSAIGFGRTKILDLVRVGRLRCVMVDGRIRIPVEALQEFRDALPKGYVAGPTVKAKADAAKAKRDAEAADKSGAAA
ncbi:MAG TPA: hypothetical protein VFC54_01370 [Pseudolabrys sp.]|nr:hypothetical protein [Pseudolabrys sp.]